MRIFYKLFCSAVLLLTPIWSGSFLWRSRTSIFQKELFDLSLSTVEIRVLTHMSILLVWAFLLTEILVILKKLKSFYLSEIGFRASSKHLLLGALAMSPSHASPSSYQASPTMPISLVLTPAVSSLILLNILQNRREQIRQRLLPRRLSEVQQVHMRKIVTVCESGTTKTCEVDFLTHSDIVQLGNSVEDIEDLSEVEIPSIDGWKVLVRLYGYPQVESTQGLIACFRKKRALELLAWLSLNRDRQRRTAARTALWDIDVSDASFSTVVSDLRRTLAEIEGSTSRNEWLPATYSDAIPLHESVITDFDLILQALNKFKNDSSGASQLAHALSLIRDVPFAGTAYSWADYDGTTTRLIVVALEAARTLAEWAISHHEREVAEVAIKAGLRVMPGCDEFLELHKSLLTLVRTSHLVASD